MNILIINQPNNNHGDEAAHKAFLRSLCYKYPQHRFTVMFFHQSSKSVDAMNVKLPNVHYVNVTAGFSRKKYDIIKTAFKLHCEKLLTMLPQFKVVNVLIKQADAIINAPGGICMGAFHNWEHIYFLKLAQWNHKPVAYYSRSFGPFDNSKVNNRLFNTISKDLLSSFRFLSIRDNKTMALADSFGLTYTKAIDTAFLDNIENNDIVLDNNYIGNSGRYCVIVPNSLRWHPVFANCSKDYIDDFYKVLINTIAQKYPDLNILMLPQLFNKADGGDNAYFKYLANNISEDIRKRIIIFEDSISSDDQQAIISHASFIIGARYHSIVFAINNTTPFVSLSYEHKMDGLLSILNLSMQSVPFAEWVKEKEAISNCVNTIVSKIESCPPIDEAKELAKRIAINCENKLCSTMSL